MSSTKIIHHFDRIVRRIDAGMHRHGRALDTERIGAHAVMVLTQLDRIAPAPAHVLVDVMGRDPSQMTRGINLLEEKGFVTRTVSDSDRRVRNLDLTPAGKAYVARLDAVLIGIVEDILEPLNDAERKALSTLLDRL